MEGALQAARLSREQAAARPPRLTALTERDGTFSVYHAEVPGAWLHALLDDWQDAPGESERVLSVEAVS